MYLSKLEDPSKIQYGLTPAFSYLNQEFLGEIIEDVIRIDFYILYPILITFFYDNKILEKFNIEIDSNIIRKIKYYQNNRAYIKQTNKDEYLKLKYEVNTFFSTRAKNNILLLGLIHQYLTLFYKDFIKDNPYSCLYIDTDTIFIADKLENVKSLDKMGVSYSIEKLELFSYSRMKRWITFSKDDDGYTQINKKGYHNPNKQYNCEDVISQMKNIYRNKKLNKLFNEDI